MNGGDDSNSEQFDDPRTQSRPSRWSTVGTLASSLPVVVVAIVVGALFLGDTAGSRRAEHGRICTRHCKQIGIALQNYHDKFRRFPPAYVAHADGKPMHSWRVLVLPYIEEREMYAQYNFSEPWNGPNNRRFADKMPSTFRCPLAPGDSNETNYVAVVGPLTVWPGSQSSKLRMISDGSSKTISIVEVNNSGINWLEPRDLSFEEALQGVNPPVRRPAISSRHAGGALAVFCDSHVSYLPDDTPLDALRALLTASGGEAVVQTESGNYEIQR
jgi:hypothetical protein